MVLYIPKDHGIRISHSYQEPAERPTTVSLAKTTSWISTVLEDPKNRLALSALSTQNPAKVLEKPSAVIKDTQNFNLKIQTKPNAGIPFHPGAVKYLLEKGVKLD